MINYRFLSWIEIDKLNMQIISSHHQAIKYLQDNPNKIDWTGISSNTAAVHLIANNLDKICWTTLCSNKSPEVLHILQKNIEKVCWSNICKNESDWINALLENNIDKLTKDDFYNLSMNPAAIRVIEQIIERTTETSIDQVNWTALSMNENAIHLLDKYNYKIDFLALQWNPNKNIINFFDKYHFCVNYDVAKCPTMIPYLKKNKHKIDYRICMNENPEACELIKEFVEQNQCLIDNPEDLCWADLSENPAASSIMKKFVSYIHWNLFCKIETKEAIEIIENYLCNVDWDVLSGNQSAMHILEKNIDKINWNILSTNIGIYESIE